MNLEIFERLYFEGMAKNFCDILPPKELIALIWSCTKTMVLNTEHKTNEAIFMDELKLKVGDKFDEFNKRFDNFYSNEYNEIKDCVINIEEIKKSVLLLKEKNYNVAIATNPLFPREAIYKRIEWAGFKPDDFIYITTFENNHFCKPQIKYYEEILHDLKKSSKECLMVGNDVQEDLIAGSLGISTYLITDNMLHRTNDPIISNYMGSYKDFYEFVNGLSTI